MRRHPLLGFTRLHAGVDFAAPARHAGACRGDGRIVQAGRNGGYGNWVEIAHAGVLSTGYAHLRGIASGIKRGARVLQNQVIGFVGSTGLSTGPHLHFELRRNGTLVDPLSVAQRSLRSQLAGDRSRALQASRRGDRPAAVGGRQPLRGIMISIRMAGSASIVGQPSHDRRSGAPKPCSTDIR